MRPGKIIGRGNPLSRDEGAVRTAAHGDILRLDSEGFHRLEEVIHAFSLVGGDGVADVAVVIVNFNGFLLSCSS